MTEPIPNMTPFEALTLNLDDLLTEARNWADGTAAETQEQVDTIASLIDQLNDGGKALEKERVTEKKPHDEAVKAIQDRYNVYLAPTTNKTVKGKVPLAVEALRAAQRPFLLAQERKLEEARQKAREEAERKAREAAEAARQADASDLEAREEAEAKIAEAEVAAKAAKEADKAKAHAHGDGRAQGLRTKHVGWIDDLNAAVKFYWQQDDGPFRELVQKLVDADIRAGRRGDSIPGVTIIEERV